MSHEILSKAIIAPKDIILNPSEIKRLALFFEQIIVYDLAGKKIDSDEKEFYDSELSFLRENDLVQLAALKPIGVMTIQRSDGSTLDIGRDLEERYDILFSPEDVIRYIPKNIDTRIERDNAIIKHLASIFKYKEAPVTSHGTIDFGSPGEKNAIEVAVKNVPMPPDNLPWQDLLDYRSDEETKRKLTALRLWMQHQHSENKNPRLMREELEHLVMEYENHLRLLTRKYEMGVIKGLITASAEAISEIATINVAGALRSLVDFKTRGIDKAIAETQAPGKEVSYISRTKSFIDNYN